MTEAEWQTSDDIDAMLEHLRSQRFHVRKVGRRKMRLFACACCRRLWDRLDGSRHDLLEQSERIADGTAPPLTDAELRLAAHVGDPTTDLAGYHARYAVWCAASPPVTMMHVAGGTAHHATYALTARQLRPSELARAESRAQCELLREIFCNPFVEMKLTRAVLRANDGAVARLAREIYDQPAFERMPLLGDALEDGGCVDERILAHCRESPKTHVRGCVVLDLAMGKG